MSDPTMAQLKAAGNAAFAAGRYAEAVEAYSAAIASCDRQIYPQGLHLLLGNRAAARLKLRDFAAALQDAEGALAVEPRWPKALYRQAAALHGLGHTAAAAAAARAALTEEPGNRDVLSLLEQLEADATAASAAAGGPAAPPAAAHKPAPTAALLPPRLAVAPWEYVPPADGVCENLLLLLHGLGDRPAAFARMGRQMALPQTAALALGGPQEVPLSDGGRSWYTVFDDSFELIQGGPGEQRRLRSLQQAVVALQQLLASLRQACGWLPNRVHVLGFSQGGTVALELARQQQASEQPVASCVAVSAALLSEQLAAEQGQPVGGSKASGSGTPVLLTHGSADKVVSRRAVDSTAEALRRSGLQASVHSVPGKGHAMPQGPTEMHELMQFWSQRLSRRPTAADLPPGAGGDGELLEVRPGEVTLERVGEA